MQEITREDLVPGKEYYLQNFEPTFAAPRKPYKMIARFVKLEPLSVFTDLMWACFTNFRKINHKDVPTYVRYVELNHNWRFYEISKDKAQKNMENRSYNMVLLDIIQDEYFTPIDVV